jgi:hypothetical protein
LHNNDITFGLHSSSSPDVEESCLDAGVTLGTSVDALRAACCVRADAARAEALAGSLVTLLKEDQHGINIFRGTEDGLELLLGRLA